MPEKKERKGLFGGSSSSNKKVADPTTTTDPGAVRKAKGFKRIRGFLTGENRKQRRARKAAERAARQARGLPLEDDDASTVYGVDVDDRSVATTPTSSSSAGSPAKSTPGMLGTSSGTPEHDAVMPGASGNTEDMVMLKVVLLLMDPDTRRFELLQLEFDSTKALVSDVLAQIPVSVTEEALREQTYVGITGATGKELNSTGLLASYCSGNDVLVAIPQGVTAKEASRLARPILSDDKVVDMLLSSGIDAKPWKDDRKNKKKAAVRALKDTGKATNKTAFSPVSAIVLGVLTALVLQVAHMYVSAPIQPGHVVSPGLWLSQCGMLGFAAGKIEQLCKRNLYVKLDRHGKMTCTNAAKETVWELSGAVCSDDDESCVPGLQFMDDGTVVVGGKTVYTVTKYDALVELTPWPFGDKPKLRVIKK